jgi:hypothetical protein
MAQANTRSQAKAWTCGDPSMNHGCLGQSASLYYRHGALSHLGAEINTILRVLSIGEVISYYIDSRGGFLNVKDRARCRIYGRGRRHKRSHCRYAADIL